MISAFSNLSLSTVTRDGPRSTQSTLVIPRSNLPSYLSLQSSFHSPPNPNRPSRPHPSSNETLEALGKGGMYQEFTVIPRRNPQMWVNFH